MATMKAGRYARGLAVLALLVAGCRPSPPPADAGTRVREGLVTSVAETGRYPLNWSPPRLPAAPARLKPRIETALAHQHLYADADAAIPLLLHYGAWLPENDHAALHVRALQLLLARGDAALAALTHDMAGAAALAHQVAAVARRFDGAAPEVQAYLTRVDAAERLEQLLELGDVDLAEGRLGETGIGARTDFGEVLNNRPGDVRALAGLDATREAMMARARLSAEARDYANVLAWMQHAARITPLDARRIAVVWQAIEQQRLAQVQQLYMEARIQLQDPNQRGALERAQALEVELTRVAIPADGALADLRTRIARARLYGAFAPGAVLCETLPAGGTAPCMRVVPAGAFDMGSDAGPKAERPQHVVVFRRGFALSIDEVTVGDFARFIQATGYRTRAERRGHSTAYDARTGNFARRSGVTWRDDYAGQPAAPTLPVVHVDANDAQAYVGWLSAQTQRAYHLPTEAQFEYALRAGGSTQYPWGAGAPPPGAGNLTGLNDRSAQGRRWANGFATYGDGAWGPRVVGGDRANAFGLHDLAGNVSEWVADCWHQGYRRAPADGAGWLNPGCRNRVLRGGSWASAPDQVRSAWRMSQSHDATNARTGFRVARDL